jgi:hypothetical protein
MDNRFVGKLYRRIVHKYFVQDMLLDLKLAAKQDSVGYIQAHLGSAMLLPDRYALLNLAIDAAKAATPDGFVAEFGVAGGKTLRHIAQRWGGLVHGFDSFQGLPEDWTGTAERAGRFDAKGKLPAVPSNAKLHPGWFDATIPPFLAGENRPAALLHLDADLYSSTRTVLDLLADRIAPGCVIVFDEYLNYPSWREHEYKAFQEFIQARGRRYRYLGFSTLQGQAAVQMTA